ncbi:hypothetical protein XENTR_v10005725 [Xenopus tropicalis]|nr:hypothetical protein XENTR_v10005725 [Xenopus tropicalis]
MILGFTITLVRKIRAWLLFTVLRWSTIPPAFWFHFKPSKTWKTTRPRQSAFIKQRTTTSSCSWAIPTFRKSLFQLLPKYI